MDGRIGCAAPRVWRIVAAATVVVLGRGAAIAQSFDDLALARLYSTGVHAYFSGDYPRSHADLSAVVEAGCRDPRALYFRGLAALRLGLFAEAEADFSMGASLEADPFANWPVSQSLERVQGADRIELERYRARARVVAIQHDHAAEAKRYSGIVLEQPDVLRKRRPAPQPDGDRDGPAVPAEAAVAPAAPEPQTAPVAPDAGGDTADAELPPEMEGPAAAQPDAAPDAADLNGAGADTGDGS